MSVATQPFKLALRARPKAPWQRRLDYDVLLNESVVREVCFNMTGYVGTLPQPCGTPFYPGETGITNYRAEVARSNREAGKGALKGREHDAKLSHS